MLFLYDVRQLYCLRTIVILLSWTTGSALWIANNFFKLESTRSNEQSSMDKHDKVSTQGLLHRSLQHYRLIVNKKHETYCAIAGSECKAESLSNIKPCCQLIIFSPSIILLTGCQTSDLATPTRYQLESHSAPCEKIDAGFLTVNFGQQLWIF